jgi:hypothetical protein
MFILLIRVYEHSEYTYVRTLVSTLNGLPTPWEGLITSIASISMNVVNTSMSVASIHMDER